MPTELSEASAPALIPRSVPQMFDAILGIARHHAWDLFALSFLLHAPVHVFRIAGALAGPASGVASWDPQRHIGAAWWVLWNALAVGGCAVAACQVFLEGTTSVRRALDAMRVGGWRLIATILLYGALVDATDIIAFLVRSQEFVALSLIAAPLAIVSFITLVYGAPAIPASEVERRGPFSAIRRAFSLVRRNSWRAAGTVWILWVVTYYLDSGLVSLFAAIGRSAAVPAVTDWAVDGALYPLRGVALAVLYFDCRVRNEGYDVERLLGAA